MLPAAYEPGDVPFSPLIFACLLLILGASTAMYVVLVRRWTSRRSWVSLAEWSRGSGFRVGRRRPDDPLPPPFDALGGSRATVRIELRAERRQLLQVGTEPADPAATLAARAATLNVLVRKIESSWPATGLRPVGAAASVIDHFSLASFPLMGTNQRFVVYGTDSAAARLLAQSSARALLPQDVGLLLHGQHLVLDFTSRPFDGLEFTRMLTLAEQLVSHLPAPKGTTGA